MIANEEWRFALNMHRSGDKLHLNQESQSAGYYNNLIKVINTGPPRYITLRHRRDTTSGKAVIPGVRRRDAERPLDGRDILLPATRTVAPRFSVALYMYVHVYLYVSVGVHGLLRSCVATSVNGRAVPLICEQPTSWRKIKGNVVVRRDEE